MKTKFYLVMAVLLSASLFLTGCPTGSGGGFSDAEKAALDLAGNPLLADKVTVSGTAVTLTDDVSVIGGAAIPAGVTLRARYEAADSDCRHPRRCGRA
jgi:predicted small secreted protein